MATVGDWIAAREIARFEVHSIFFLIVSLHSLVSVISKCVHVPDVLINQGGDGVGDGDRGDGQGHGRRSHPQAGQDCDYNSRSFHISIFPMLCPR